MEYKFWTEAIPNAAPSIAKEVEERNRARYGRRNAAPSIAKEIEDRKKQQQQQPPTRPGHKFGNAEMMRVVRIPIIQAINLGNEYGNKLVGFIHQNFGKDPKTRHWADTIKQEYIKRMTAPYQNLMRYSQWLSKLSDQVNESVKINYKDFQGLQQAITFYVDSLEKFQANVINQVGRYFPDKVGEVQNLNKSVMGDMKMKLSYTKHWINQRIQSLLAMHGKTPDRNRPDTFNPQAAA